MQKIRTRLAAILIASLAGAAMPLHVRADGDDHRQFDDGDMDYDDVLEGVRAGRLLSLASIKQKVLAAWPGEIVDLSIDGEKGTVIYEIKILAANGNLIEVEVDARSGKVLEVEND
ncbi:PepSY domain-containing protein [Rhizobium alvei]|uniref:PepSY domain-containing protein n=1 Tax=Rhizobium alvei TaxID=1132659 RepID=A0ABT8YKW5_9HYPH|nr:PepSY domain-containing protein [Rhizobium alvei]MDO6964336.1 PepSY domain-containing protein [Rhizobium alvei]